MNHLNATRAAAVGVALLAALGCGQKGPLYLPDHNAAVVTRPGGGAQNTAPAQPAQPAEAPKTDATPTTAAPPPSTTPSATAPPPGSKKKDSDEGDSSPGPK